MAARSGIPLENVCRMYDKFCYIPPTAVFEKDKWNACFPISPFVSVGSA